MFGFGFVDNISQRTIYAKTSSNNYGWTNGGQNVQPPWESKREAVDKIGQMEIWVRRE